MAFLLTRCVRPAVYAVNQEYTKGLTLWQHKVIKNLAAIEADKVDIIALALAKDKIQEIVEREWQKSCKGKTRKSMARWLGIGRNGFGVSDVSISINESSDSTQSQSSEHNQNFESLFEQTDSIVGISDLGNAFTVQSNLDVHIVDSHSDKIEETSDSNTDAQSLKAKKNRNSANNQQVTHSKKLDESQGKADNWKPDVSGWYASYGLPK